MSTEAIPGGGPGGQGPSVSVPADGLCGEDEDAWLRRMMAEADADEAWICEEQAVAALSVLAADGGLARAGGRAGAAGRAADDPAGLGGLAQDGSSTRWRRLGVQLAPIAKGECDHRHHSDRYVISRKVKHLIKARTAKCTAPGCDRPAAEADADHTIPWPDGPSCECNLGAPCRYHHRNKQAPGWRLEQPAPDVMKWHNPSGRIHSTYPTKYII